MTIIKKILSTSITLLAIAGMVLMSTPASAGFFDWFSNTPLNQEAAAIKSFSKEDVKYESMKYEDSKAVEALKYEQSKADAAKAAEALKYADNLKAADLQAQEAKAKDKAKAAEALKYAEDLKEQEARAADIKAQKNKESEDLIDEPSAVTKFFKSFFYRPSDEDNSKSYDQKEYKPAVTRVSDNTPVAPEPDDTGIDENNAYVIGCGTSDVNFCESFCLDIGGTPDASGSGSCALSDNAQVFAFEEGTTSNPTVDVKHQTITKKLQLWDVDPQVGELQRILKALRLYNGRIDNSYGKGTAAAVRLMQKDIAPTQIFTTGNKLGNKTLKKIEEQVKMLNRGNGSETALGGGTCNPGDPASITVLSPNGGQVYEAGSQVTVEWESCNIGSEERIQLNIYKESYSFYNAPLTVQNPYPGMFLGANMTDNDGHEIVSLPNNYSQEYYENYQSGNDFKIMIQALDTSSGSVFYDDLSDNFFTISANTSTLGQISYWWGKVNLHKEIGGIWTTDLDGVSGANLNKLTYCQKFWPDTVTYEESGTETITGWYPRGNVGNPMTSTKMTYNCLGEAQTQTPPMSWEWMTLSNTTLNNDTNHLVGKLRITNNSSDDITFEGADSNYVAFQFNRVFSGPVNSTLEQIRFRDQQGTPLDSDVFSSNTNSSDVSVGFSHSNLDVSPSSSEDIYIYANSSEFNSMNDSMQLCLNPLRVPPAIHHGVNGSGNISSNSTQIINDMPSNCAQVHINPNGQTPTPASGLIVSVDSSSPISPNLVLDANQEGRVKVGVFRLANNTNEPLNLDSFKFSDVEAGRVADSYHVQARSSAGTPLGSEITVFNTNGPAVASWPSGIEIPVNGNIRVEISIETRDVEVSSSNNADRFQVVVLSPGDVRTTGVNTNDDHDSTESNLESALFHMFESYPEFEWLTVTNTTLTQNANHLAAKLKITAVGDEDITFETAAGNMITSKSNIVQDDDDFGVADPRYTVMDDLGQTVDTLLWASNGTSDIMNNFSTLGLTVSSGSSETLYYYLNSSDLDTDNDSSHLYLDDGYPGDLSWSINSNGGDYDEYADILWRGDHMTDRYSQVHVNPS
ncbi:MAG: hypothetical protein ACI88L_000263 [Candidatus Paceibacteria bacterium]|jgi:hypothetical protein